MTGAKTRKPLPKKALALRRRAVPLAGAEHVSFEPLAAVGGLPIVARPTTAGVDLGAWLGGHREVVRQHQLHTGGVLFRGFDIADVDQFEAVVREFSAEDPALYRDATTPRSAVQGHVYTSTDYPPDQSIFFHSELAYSRSWPMNLFFFSLVPAEQGGETPIADTRKILERIDPEIVETFRRRRVLYVRNYGEGLGLDWRDVFKTDDRAQAEAFCAEAGIAVEWRGDDRLRTRAARDAIARHPETGEEVWFNHVVLFHASSLDPTVRRTLEQKLGEDGLPHTTFYGDGSKIEQGVIDHLRSVTLGEAVVFPWQKGDVLLLDNMLTAHGRNPYRGERRLLAAMNKMYPTVAES